MTLVPFFKSFPNSESVDSLVLSKSFNKMTIQSKGHSKTTTISATSKTSTFAPVHKICEHIDSTLAAMLLIERDALTSVLERPPCTGNGDELIDVSCGKEGDSPCIFIGEKGDSPFLRDECTSFDDDTASTASFSDSSYEDDKRVSFADALVSDVWERPRTQPEEVSKLFFSSEETQR